MGLVRELGGSLKSSKAMAESNAAFSSGGYEKRSGICLNILVYAAVFSSLILGLKYAGSLELGTVSSVEHVPHHMPTNSSNQPPEAAYFKTELKDLKIKTSSFQV